MIIGSDHSKILSELSCPVGFYYGEHTIEFKEGELKTMKDLLPKDSPIFGLKDAQHHLMLDQPLPFIENLDRIDSRTWTKSSLRHFSINHIINMANTTMKVSIRKALS